MRIAMLHWAFPPIIGGVETHLSLLCPDLVKQGHRVSLLTANAPGTPELPEKEYWQGVTIWRSPLLDLNTLTTETIEAKAEEIKHLFEDFLLEASPDIVHAHNFHYFSYVHAYCLQEICRSKGWPLVLTAHNVWEDELWQQMNTLAQGWNYIIAVSHFIRQELIVNGYPEERVAVVYHGINTTAFRPPAPSELEEIYKHFPQWRGRRVIFHPARMSRAKGCDVSILALDLIRKEVPDVLLLLAGTNNTVDWEQKQAAEITYMQELIEDLNLWDHVYIRFFPWQEIPKAYKAAEVCLYPSSFQEPFGLVMLEAMASGKPIIVSRAGGMPEIICPGFNGFIISMGNYRELAKHTVFLLCTPQVANAIGQRGRRLVEDKYTTAVMARETLAVYQQLLALPKAS